MFIEIKVIVLTLVDYIVVEKVLVIANNLYYSLIIRAALRNLSRRGKLVGI